MMKQLLSFGIILFLLPVSLKAQKGYNISITIYNYKETELTLAYYLGEKQYIKQTATKGANGSFVFKGDTALHCGLYMLVTKPNNDFVEFIIPPDDQTFSLTTDINNMAGTLKADGSEENKVFINHLDFMRVIRAASDSLDKALEADNSKAQLIEAKRESLDKKMSQYKNALYADHKDKTCVAIIKSSEEPVLPEFTGTEQEIENKQFYWYRQHFFDAVDFSSPCLFYSPVLLKRINSYMNDLTVQQADSVNKSLDVIFSKAAVSKENLKFLAIHYLNHYAKSNIVGFDACYVHIANKFYCNGKADWVEAEQLKKICDNAKKLEPVLIGKKAPDFKLTDTEKEIQNLSDIKADYLIIYFWDSDYPSSNKGAIQLVEIAKKYNSDGVKVLTLHTNSEIELEKYNEISMKLSLYGDNLINAILPENSLAVKQLYDVTSLPSIYVLDKEQKIISKRISADQVPQILDYELRK
jgi:peroxiredoxin